MPTWTSAPPAVAGDYLFRCDKFPDQQEVRVIENGGVLFAMFGKRAGYSLGIVTGKFEGCQWAGPIGPPQEASPCST